MRSLGSHGQAKTGAGDGPLRSALSNDRWPVVRIAAASALSSRCQALDVVAALERAATGDAETKVRIAVLSELFGCKPLELHRILLDAAVSEKQAAEVRTHAIKLAGATGSQEVIPALLELFDRERRGAFDNQDKANRAAAAAAALGKLKARAAIPSLLSATRDEGFPSIQAAAVAALGQLCPKEATRVFANLITSGQRQVAIAARRARAQCKAERP
jgi:HEAT repeat protein